jgi:hypothetical protein
MVEGNPQIRMALNESRIGRDTLQKGGHIGIAALL